MAPLFFFWPATSGQLAISPDDGVIFNVPLRVAAARIALDGYAPLWNPYLFGGMPLHGAAQAGLLFPLNWFYLAFTPFVATNLMMLSTYALAALGAYLCARRSGSSIAGALAASLAWQWSGFLLNQVGHTNVAQTAAMLPWIVWAVDSYAESGGRGRGVALAALVALQAFTGHQQTFAYTLLLVAAYAVWMARAETGRRRASYLWALALIAAGVALSAAQILPTFETLRNSPRTSASYDFFTSFSMPPRFALNFLAPYLSGGGDGRLFRAPYVGPAFFGEYVGYVGLLTLMLALLAVWLKPDARTRFWAVAALVCLALAFGRFWPLELYGAIYYVPVLNLFRVPARHLMEVEFALVLLAGRGLTALAAARGDTVARRRALVVGAGIFALTCLAVTWGRPADFRLAREAPVQLLRAPELFMPVALAALSAWALWAFARGARRGAVAWLLGALALDLIVWGQSSGWRASSPRADSELWRVPATVKFLRERESRGDAEPYRIMTVQQSFDPALPVPVPTPTGFLLSLQPDTYMMHGIENAAGYDGFGVARYSRLAGDMTVWGELSDAERTLRGEGRELDLINVRYLLTQPQPSPSSGASSAPSASSAALFPPATQTHGGYLFAAENLNAPSLDKEERLSFDVPPVEADRVALLTNLSWSVNAPDGSTVGRVRLRSADGRTYDFDLRAGIDTSEWAYDRRDIRAQIKHRRAALATSYEVADALGNYEAHSYVTSFALPERAVIVGGEISVARLAQAPDLALSVQRVSLVDTPAGRAFPLSRERVKKLETAETAPSSPEPSSSAPARPEEEAGALRWRRLAQAGDVSIFENTRVLPRAWLATSERVAGEQETLDIIRAGRLPDGRAWEPLRVALVEAPSGAGFGAAAEPGKVEVTRHEPNRIRLQVSAPAPAILVLSENHYPGWRAYIDGRRVEMMRVNYNLRGVAMPAGAHVVEFVYRPLSVIIGFAVSLLALVALLLWQWGFLPEARARRVGARLLRKNIQGVKA